MYSSRSSLGNLVFCDNFMESLACRIRTVLIAISTGKFVWLFPEPLFFDLVSKIAD